MAGITGDCDLLEWMRTKIRDWKPCHGWRSLEGKAFIASATLCSFREGKLNTFPEADNKKDPRDMLEDDTSEDVMPFASSVPKQIGGFTLDKSR